MDTGCAQVDDGKQFLFVYNDLSPEGSVRRVARDCPPYTLGVAMHPSTASRFTALRIRNHSRASGLLR
ncbi:hypothetical protein M3A73_02725 [Pseudoglutamicibacter cumminsii]|nr:hypothetical protein [Pseudoglutamicibacter cumminsii]MCT1685805.1 hypothetical protein [Pseudoglutamicibacter cumminsii]